MNAIEKKIDGLMEKKMITLERLSRIEKAIEILKTDADFVDKFDIVYHEIKRAGLV